MMKVDIAIITIREDEFEAVRRRFKTKRRRIPEGRTYLLGEVETYHAHYTIAITRCSEQGNDASQRLASDIIYDLKPEIILVVGIAGGVPDDEFTLGDVIVSTRILNLNVSAQNADGTAEYAFTGGSHPLIEDITSLLPGETRLSGWNEPTSVGLKRPDVDPQQVNIKGDDAWREKVRKSLEWHFGEEQKRHRLPIYKTGHIISSNNLMKNPSILRQWLTTNRSVLAVEMESAGVFVAAQRMNRTCPVLAIRGISDIPGLQRDRRWTAYACQTAAAFAYTFIMTTLELPQLGTSVSDTKPHDASTGGRSSLYDQIRDYTNTIEEKTRDFVGREFVFDEVKHFIKTHQSGYFFIEGDPGIGKTALAAQMVKTYGYVHHFNIRGEGIDDAEQFLSNICAQLIVTHRLEYSSLPPHTTHDAGFLNRLLSETASKVGSTDNVVIVIDALDEVDTHNLPPGTNPLYLPLTLPQGIFIIVTTRRGVIPRIEHERHILKLNADDERNKADIRVYIEQHIGQLGIQTYINNHQTDDTSFIRRLEEKSEGNFMYLHHVLRDIEEGAYGDLRLEDLPCGLENYYEDHWKRMGMMETPLPHTKIVIIYLLAEVRQPASLRFIADCVGTDAATVQQVLIEWDPFFHKPLIEGEHRYSIYHTSFRDFLHRKETVQAVSITLPGINDLIAQNLMRKLGLE